MADVAGREANAARRQRVDVRGRDHLAAVDADVGVTEVVGKDENDVRRRAGAGVRDRSIGVGCGTGKEHQGAPMASARAATEEWSLITCIATLPSTLPSRPGTQHRTGRRRGFAASRPWATLRAAMMSETERQPAPSDLPASVQRLELDQREVFLVGTAHVSAPERAGHEGSDRDARARHRLRRALRGALPQPGGPGVVAQAGHLSGSSARARRRCCSVRS